MLLHLLPFALLNRAWVAAAPTQPMSTLPNDTSDEMIGWVSPDARRNTHNESIAGWHKIKLCSGIEIPYWPEHPLLWKWTRKLIWMALTAVAPEYGVAMALAQHLEAKNDMKKANRATNGITEEDIRDLGKSDAFTKVFALLQCTWLVVQSIARTAQGHAISQLELATLAFIPCALVMYILWWQKPFGIERRHVLLRLPENMNNLPADFTFSIDDLLGTEPGEKLLNMRMKDSGSDKFFDLILMGPDESNRPTDKESTENYIAERRDTAGEESADLTESTSPTNPIPMLSDRTANVTGGPTIAEAVNRVEQETTNAKTRTKALSPKVLLPFLPSIILYFTAVLFSAIHLAAWKWYFPPYLVRELWRWFALAALLTSLSPVAIIGFIMLLDKGPLRKTPEWLDDVITTVMVVLAYVVFFFYTAARLVILGLTLYSQSSMPEGAYGKVSWMAWIPHFS
ncbi:hypothetical protein FAGAP_626 [Fusarium agapanthi]|uniref:Uncharacterized protein n=1 Tax=Fusarium agapanthi TaxID=1803897 RepID=A0A9P5BKM8_9HYPO|nr:hypothetical protein FAGAP_626 [Fusarium agapanthi]